MFMESLAEGFPDRVRDSQEEEVQSSVGDSDGSHTMVQSSGTVIGA